MKTVLSQRLRAARNAISPVISQRDAARHMGMSPSAVNLWESGKTEPSATDLAELAKWYGVSTDWLLGVDTKVVVHKTHPSTVKLWTVPVVSAESLVRWHWEKADDLLQTASEYPPQTAAAVLVSSAALSSVCPVGSYAVVSKGRTLESGQIVLATTGKSTEPVLRKYVVEGSDALLIADDVRYPSYHLDDGVKIIGCVTEITQRNIL